MNIEMDSKKWKAYDPSIINKQIKTVKDLYETDHPI